MPKRELALYVVDIFIAASKVKRYTKDFKSAEAFLLNDLHWDATMRELQIIGEATTMLIKYDFVDDNFREIVDFRNHITHAYFGIDENIVWEVVKTELDKYIEQLTHIVKNKKLDLTMAISSAIDENQKNRDVVEYLRALQTIFAVL